MQKLIEWILSLFRKPEPKPAPPVTRTSDEGVRLIKYYEGVRLKAYRDAVDVLTIGYGHTGPDVHEGMTITQEQAEKLLALRLAMEFEPAVLGLLRIRPSQHEFDALVSFTYNVGTDAFEGSTLLRKFNAGDMMGAANEFYRWDKAGGKSLKGLRRRRAAERAMFLGSTAEEAIAVGLDTP